ncbi:TonB-dependent hemoglobin/transferrin/lactoferrin family receptor [Niveispirillum sp. BGYR6]|uniref:TonB-dependent hemoglobin/transferrin/lactoferrin family receptor n=1 Tax=Niveispirillum sp. BGYR6 TaxID=2971249 RepID=UPI0022B97476|nr:TonB-dependent hemoglobin/transferrin/lactoferrin family receptor [Niveispirillum sp. BGYR6]MDG5497794.1 TonB-dependent hemoglobin/transferrin/lactoferrin family receptor [Niveispirillum sp. BGYR6]
MRRSMTALPLVMLAMAGTAMAQGVPVTEQQVAETQVSEITVIATRTPKTTVEAPATVSLIESKRIDDQMVNDIKDLIRYEPGVSVRAAPARFTAAGANTGRDGNSGFNIRGLEGNRVLIQTDGIRLPDAFAFGGQSVGRGDYVDLDLLKSVEILRGPASALYGSDGVAGAVSFVTKDPSDFIKPGHWFGGQIKAGYASADESWAKGMVVAASSGAWSVMAAYNRRDAKETENQGSNASATADRTKPNPQDIGSNAVLGKIVFQPNDAHKLRLTYEYDDRDMTADVLTARSSTVSGLLVKDTSKRNRISLDHQYQADLALLEALHWTAYHQNSKTRQFSGEDRTVLADRIRDNYFDNKVSGVNIDARTRLKGDGIEHLLVYGGDYSFTKQVGTRSGTVPPAGESFPTRAFPTTDYQLAGLFVQDEVTLLDGALSLFPALRYDYYKLEPKQDRLFPSTASGQSDDRLSPKISALYWFAPSVGLYANYAEGFKAPAPSQVNNGFSNPVQNYRSISNPDLKPETSRTVEAGFRFRGEGWSGNLTGFSGWYKNFIEQAMVSGNFTAARPATYQYVNLARVEIKGLEAKGQMALTDEFGLIAAASYTKGDEKEAGVKTPLDSVDPFKLVAGLTWQDQDDRFGGELSATYSAKKSRGRISDASLYAPDSFVILDLMAHWNVSEDVTLRAGIFNLFDKKYWWWSDVRGVAATSKVLDSFTQPGRNASVSLTVKL